VSSSRRLDPRRLGQVTVSYTINIPADVNVTEASLTASIADLKISGKSDFVTELNTQLASDNITVDAEKLVVADPVIISLLELNEASQQTNMTTQPDETSVMSTFDELNDPSAGKAPTIAVAVLASVAASLL